ncbi:MAG: hypothetical protein U9Q77_11655 [Candidatus Marinimicrobia bacterium]|nr:hypothetical protein [Candidatus Neomarinimicrobiota bacterium]
MVRIDRKKYQDDMSMVLNYFKWIKLKSAVAALGAILLLGMPPAVYGQEEDLFGDESDESLLFGDEFDLGSDDLSFDFEDDEEADTTTVEEDDFFGDYDDESDEETADTTEIEDDWGFGDDFNFDDSLGVDSTDQFTETEFSDHPLNFRQAVHGTFMEGTGLTISFYSPQYVADKMSTWYSYMDYSMSIEFPWHYEVDPANISFLLDVSSFNFKNSFPAGGSFTGVSIMPMVRAEAFGLEAEAGVGMYAPTFGIMAGLGYSYQYQSIFISAGYRWNWAYNIDPIGSGWWLEPRFTTGIKLW